MALRKYKIDTRHYPFYKAWIAMKQRCNDKNHVGWKYWGGKGIKYDPRWELFENFQKDMESTYEVGLSLDRIDNNQNYSKNNCRWIIRGQQNLNKSNLNRIKFNGKNLLLSEWANILGIKRSTLAQRYYVYKWNIEKCLTQEVA